MYFQLQFWYNLRIIEGEHHQANLEEPEKNLGGQQVLKELSSGTEVQSYDPNGEEFKVSCEHDGESFKPGEGSISRYLQLGKGNVSGLIFRDETNILYIEDTQKLH